VPGGSRSESPNLDFLRAVAVLSVYYAHALDTFGLADLRPSAKPDLGWFLGRFGVLIFFVHTSLVLMMSLERAELAGRPLFSSFYLRRFFRIYPLSMACVAVVVFFHLPGPLVEWFHPDRLTILTNFLLCTNLFHKWNVMSVLWTLPLEVQMYVLLPIVYLLGKKYGMRGITLLWLGAVIASYMPRHVSGRFMLAPYIPCFVAGVASYFVGFGSTRSRLPSIGWPLTIGAAAGIFFVLRSRTHFEGSWIMCAAIGLSAPLFAELEFAPLRKLSAWVARYSYGIYLTHMYALWTGFIVLKDQPVWVRCAVGVGLSVGLPVMFYEIIESPMIRVGTRLANQLPRATKSRARPDARFGAPKGSDAAERANARAPVESSEMES